jgi:hypothetical protein
LIRFKTRAIAPIQDARTKALEVQCFSNSNHAGRFASPAHTKIAYKNNGNRKFLMMEKADLKTPFTNPNDEAVNE